MFVNIAFILLVSTGFGSGCRDNDRLYMKHLKKSSCRYDAWNLFQDIPRPNLFHYNKMISICKWSLQDVQYLLDQMKGNQIKPDIITYSTALNTFKEDHAKFREIWNEMKGKQIEPNIITYNTALNAFKEDHAKFREIWNEMKGKQIEPDTITYNTALNAFKENHAKFREIWKEMKGKQIEPDFITHMEILDFLENCGEITEGKKYFEENCSDILNLSQDRDVDCHQLSHGAAVLQILIYLDRYPDQQDFGIITGKGLHNNEPHAMRKYVIAAMENRHPRFHIIDGRNSGLIKIQKKQ